MNAQSALAAVRAGILDLTHEHTGFGHFLWDIANLGSWAVVGGAARDWALGEEPNDIDIAVDASQAQIHAIAGQYMTRLNSFGGYECLIDGVSVDVWSLRDAPNMAHLKREDRGFQAQSKHSSFASASLVVDVDGGMVYECGFFECFATKCDRILKTMSSQYSFAKANAMKARYGLRFDRDSQYTLALWGFDDPHPGWASSGHRW